MPIQNYYLRGNHRDTFRLVPVGNENPSNFIHVPTPISGYAQFQANTQNYYVYARPAYTSEFTLLDSFVGDDYLYLRLLNPNITSEGIVELSLSAISLELSFSSDNNNIPYIRDLETVLIKVSSYSGGAPHGPLLATPTVKLYERVDEGTDLYKADATHDSDLDDSANPHIYWYRYTFNSATTNNANHYFVANASIENVTSNEGSEAFQLHADYIAPTLTTSDGVFISSPASGVGAVGETPTEAVYLAIPSSAIADSGSGPKQLHLQPYIQNSLATTGFAYNETPGTDYEFEDTNLATWDPSEIEGYQVILDPTTGGSAYDGDEVEGTIVSYTAGVFVISLDNVPTASTYSYRIYKSPYYAAGESSFVTQSEWPIQINTGANVVQNVLLTAGLGTGFVVDLTNIEFGFIVSGSDKALNSINTYDGFLYPSIVYDTITEVAPAVSYWFAKDNENGSYDQLYANENGWFSESNFRIIVKATDVTGVQSTSFGIKISNDGTTWHSLNATANRIDWDGNGSDDDSIFYVDTSYYREGNSVLYLRGYDGTGAPGQIHQIEYKWDQTLPIWTNRGSIGIQGTYTQNSAACTTEGGYWDTAEDECVNLYESGGFNKAYIKWGSDSPPEDPVPPNEGNSNISHIKIYRNENTGTNPTVWGNFTPSYVGDVNSSDGEFLDTSFNVDYNSSLNPYLYWGAAVDYAGNEQSIPILLSSINGITVTPLVSADVAGALGETKVIDDDTVIIEYGVSVPLEALTLRTPSSLTKIKGIHNLEYAGGSYGDTYTKVETLTSNDQDFAVFHIEVSTIVAAAGAVVELAETPAALGIDHLVGPPINKGAYIRFNGNSGALATSTKDFVTIESISGAGGNTILTFSSLSLDLIGALAPTTTSYSSFEFGLILETNTTYSYAFPTVQNTYKWNIQFNNTIGSEILAKDVHLSSILAADLIVGGTLRLENGLSIWSGDFTDGEPSGTGMTIDTLGLTMFAGATETVNMDANTGDFSFGHGLNKLTFESGSLNLFGNFHQIQANSSFAGMTFTLIGAEWAVNTTYAVGDVIEYGGNYWVWINPSSTLSTYAPQVSNDWALYASFGIEGESAKGLSITSNSQVFIHAEDGSITSPGEIEVTCVASNIVDDIYWRAVGYYETEVLINSSSISGTVQSDLSIDVTNMDLTADYFKGILPGDLIYISSDTVTNRVIESVLATKITVTDNTELSAGASITFDIKTASREVMLYSDIASTQHANSIPILNGSSVYLYSSTFLSGENADQNISGIFGPLSKVIIYLEQIVTNIDSQLDEILYFDSFSVHRLIEGNSAYNILTSNEAHLEYVNEYGTGGDWTNASTEVRLYKGTENINCHIEVPNSQSFTNWTVTGPTSNDGQNPYILVNGDSAATTSNTAVYTIDVYDITDISNPGGISDWSTQTTALVGSTSFTVTKIPEGTSNKTFKLAATSATWTLNPDTNTVMSPTLDGSLSIHVSALTSNIDVNIMEWTLETGQTSYTHTLNNPENEISTWGSHSGIFEPASNNPPTYKVQLSNLGATNNTLSINVSVSGVDGIFTDTITLSKLEFGTSGLTSWLSNESYAETAEYNIGDFINPSSAADGTFIVYRGESLVATNTIEFETGAWYGRYYDGSTAAGNLTISHFNTLTPDITKTVMWSSLDENSYISEGNSNGYSFFSPDSVDNFSGWLTTWIKVDSTISISNLSFDSDNAANLYINNDLIGSGTWNTSTTWSYGFTTTAGKDIPNIDSTNPGAWYRLDILYTQGGGGDTVRINWNPSTESNVVAGGGLVQGEIDSEGNYTIHGLTAANGVLPLKATVTNADDTTSELFKTYTISRALEGEPGTYTKSLYYMASYTANLSAAFTTNSDAAFYPDPTSPQTLGAMLDPEAPWLESLPDMYSNLGMSVWVTSREYRTDDTEIPGTVWSVPNIFLYQPTSVQQSYLKPLDGTAFLTTEAGGTTPASLRIKPVTVSVENGEVTAVSSLKVWDAETADDNTITQLGGDREYTFYPSDITGSTTIYLIDTNNGAAIIDTISLVDVTDGTSGNNAPIGYVTVENINSTPTLSFIQTVNQITGEYSWSDTTLTVTATIIDTDSVTKSVSATITNSNGALSVTDFTGDTAVITAASTATEGQLGMSFTHTSGFVVSETVYSVYAGTVGVGIDGAPGSFTAYVFHRSASAPAEILNGSYTEDTGLTAPTGWDTTADGPDGTDTLWVTTTLFSPPSTYASNTPWPYPGWAEPIQLEGHDGNDAGLLVIWNSTASPAVPTSTPPDTPADPLYINSGDATNGWGTSTSNAVWMSINTYSAGLWSGWVTSQVRGVDGAAGPGVVYRGEYDATEAYTYSSVRRDIVKHVTGNGGPYWICTNTTLDNAPGTTSIHWEEFGATFSSVATGLLLTENAVITNELTIGEEGTANGQIIAQGTDANGHAYYILNKDGITATGGKIASFNIQEDSLTSDDGKLIIHTGTNPYIEIG